VSVRKTGRKSSEQKPSGELCVKNYVSCLTIDKVIATIISSIVFFGPPCIYTHMKTSTCIQAYSTGPHAPRAAGDQLLWTGEWEKQAFKNVFNSALHSTSVCYRLHRRWTRRYVLRRMLVIIMVTKACQSLEAARPDSSHPKSFGPSLKSSRTRNILLDCDQTNVFSSPFLRSCCLNPFCSYRRLISYPPLRNKSPISNSHLGRSTQPSTLCGMVNEYQLLGWVIINDDGGYSYTCCIEADLRLESVG